MGIFSRSRSVPSSETNGSVDQNTVSDFASNSVRSKKDRKKAISKDQTPLHSPQGSFDDDSQQQEEYFLPLSLERPTLGGADNDHDGYFPAASVVLGLEQVNRLTTVLVEELSSRGGLDTPFIFSTLSLDIKVSAIKRLATAFLGTCVVSVGREKDLAEQKWREEARFANMHELGMCLRWGLARVARIIDGVECRGLLNWDHYIQWAEAEQTLNYPPTHFREFLTNLQPPLRLILLTILSLLARLTAHSATSGHTPPTLSPLFGPLIFGLGPSGLPFNHTYTFYLRSVNAFEHLILGFIRWQNTSDANQNILTGTVPPRLKEWIKGYPAMLDTNSNYRFSASSTSEQRHRPRKGARTVRLTSVRRNVKNYERDLVKAAPSWGEISNGTSTPSSGGPTGGFAYSDEWLRISPLSYGYETSASFRIPPRYSEAYKKRLNLPNTTPETGFSHSLSSPAADYNSPPPSAFTTKTTFSLATTLTDGDFFSSNARLRPGERGYKSLTDEKWGNFEDIGFGGLGVDGATDKKLQFDLTEGAKSARLVRRETLDWKSFTSSGFSRSDVPLQSALQLSIPQYKLDLNGSSSPVTSPITPVSSPPVTPSSSESKKLRKKLKNGGHNINNTFIWDLEPILGSEQIIEEAFLDVYCDLLRGSGWIEGLNPSSAENRPCNWALVEFKALPIDGAGRPVSEDYTPDRDPRTSTTLLLFEEFVPREYREQQQQQLATLHE